MSQAFKLQRRSSRRCFLGTSISAAASFAAAALFPELVPANSLPGGVERRGAKMRFGLVTYLWGKDWDLPTLIRNCEATQVLGVELRTTHAHAVERSLNSGQREAVKKRFADSPVELVGIGSNERFDNPDPDVLQKAIEATNAFTRLSYDVGGSGVKVKPDRFHDGVPREKTIEQIGTALNSVAAYAADFGQQIRLEVHGQCAQLPTIKQILDVADHPNVAACWNSNPQDLEGPGLRHNFGLVKNRFGKTAHVHQLTAHPASGNYPYQQLIDLFATIDYDGWILLEASGAPDDRLAALREQLDVFARMVTKAQYA